MAERGEAPLRVPLGALFVGFFSIGVCGFGGVLPWARRMIVDQRRWMDAAEFTDLLALCQFLPGPNVINLSVTVGGRFAGWRGALTAYVGLMAAPMVIVVILGAIYARYGGLPVVQGMFHGLAAAASGLVVATSLKIAAPIGRNPVAIAVAATALAAVALLRLPLVLVLATLVPASLALHLWRLRRRANNAVK